MVTIFVKCIICLTRKYPSLKMLSRGKRSSFVTTKKRVCPSFQFYNHYFFIAKKSDCR
jgi:hypothetical protein